MKTKEQIIQWYKDNGYYEEFVKEVERQHGKSFEEIIEDIEGFLTPTTLLTWGKTDSGYGYWNRAQERFYDWFFNEETDEQPKQPTPTKEIDWEQRRYEIAKDAMCALSCGIVVGEVDPNPSVSWLVEHAVTFTDALINELKKNKEKL